MTVSAVGKVELLPVIYQRTYTKKSLTVFITGENMDYSATEGMVEVYILSISKLHS